MRKYPTRKEIEECKIVPTKEQKATLKSWKTKVWKTAESNMEKEVALAVLCTALSPQGTSVKYNPYEKASYIRKTKTITLCNFSIITALHETGHSLYPAKKRLESETYACSWSIKIFKEVFPVAFKKLHWEGHTLKR